MTKPTGLSVERVTSIFMNCLFKDGEDTDTYILAPGIFLGDVGFHPARIEKNRPKIVAMLNELPDSFQESGGGGMSFLSACFDRNGRQWTGLHSVMEQLFQLGSAIGMVGYLMERELWPVLPGGLPYLVVYDDPKKVELKTA